MAFRIHNKYFTPDRSASFDMTAIIDIVFLLIIFFLVVCQFIEAENFPVAVPEGCGFAERTPDEQSDITTVTVIKTLNGKSEFAVGSEKISTLIYSELIEKIADLLNVRMKDEPVDRRVVTLRIDKDVCFAEAQYALAGVAASCATNIQIAAIKDKPSF